MMAFPMRRTASLLRCSLLEVASFGRQFNVYSGRKLRLDMCLNEKCSINHIMPRRQMGSGLGYTIMNIIVESHISSIIRNCYIVLHDVTGFPWWACIVLSPHFFIILSLPSKIYQERLVERQRIIHKEMEAIVERYEIDAKWKHTTNNQLPVITNAVLRREIRNEYKKLQNQYDYHPAKFFFPLVLTSPLWVCASVTWRTMSYGFSDDIHLSNIMTSQMLVEGPLWCSDLCGPDNSYVTPVLIFMALLINGEIKCVKMSLHSNNERYQKLVLIFQRLAAALFGCVSLYIPSSVALFFLSATISNTMQDILLLSPKARKLFGLHYSPVTYKEVLQAFKKKWGLVRLQEGTVKKFRSY